MRRGATNADDVSAGGVSGLDGDKRDIQSLMGDITPASVTDNDASNISRQPLLRVCDV